MFQGYIAEPHNEADPIVRESGLQTDVQALAFSYLTLNDTGLVAEYRLSAQDGRLEYFPVLGGTTEQLAYVSDLSSYVETSAMQAALSSYELLLPSQTGNSGKYLTTNGTAKSWATIDLSTKQDAAAFLTTLVGIGGTSGTGNLARVASPTFTGTVNAEAITASGIVDARTATTGHRLGHFGHQDSVTVGWPGSSFGGYQCGANGIVSWHSMGLAFGANATGVVEVNSGTNVAFGGSLRDMTLRSMTASGTVRLGTYTVATLPSASANTRALAFVTDSNLAFNSTNLGATVTAGGSTLVPVFSNGTNWVIG